MRKSILFLALFCSLQINGQGELLRALDSGSGDLVGQMFGERVEISIFDQEQSLPKADAIAMTKNFFNAHQIDRFSKMHEVASKDKHSQYLIGKLISKDRQFKIFINYQKSGEAIQIHEMRIEKEE
jgi:hypothetical protein